MLKATEEMENSNPLLDQFRTVTADKDFIYFPGKQPKPRKHANVWRDATEEEMKQHVVQNDDINTNDNFFEDFMRIAD